MKTPLRELWSPLKEPQQAIQRNKNLRVATQEEKEGASFCCIFSSSKPALLVPKSSPNWQRESRVSDQLPQPLGAQPKGLTLSSPHPDWPSWDAEMARNKEEEQYQDQFQRKSDQSSQVSALQRTPASSASSETSNQLQISLVWNHRYSYPLISAAWVPLCPPLNPPQPPRRPCAQQPAQACGRPRCQPRAPTASLPPLRTSTPDTWHNLQGHVCTDGKILPQKCTLITKAYKACVGQDLTPFPVISLFHWAHL